MKNTIRLVLTFGFIGLCALIISTPKATVVESVEVTVAPEELPAEVIIPVEISIESIGVSAPIELVGVLNGAMAVPSLPENVGWYEFGTRPGEIGSAVLAGHVNWKNSPNAVFTNLKNIQIGDLIRVTSSDGEVIYFSVNEIKSFPLYSDTSEVFLSNDGLSHLNLITCSGIWNSIIKSHESRLVIFATKFDT